MEKIKIHIIGEMISSNDAEAFSLHKKSCFGEPSGEKIQYTPSEIIFLVEKGKAEAFLKSKKIPKKELILKIIPK